MFHFFFDGNYWVVDGFNPWTLTIYLEKIHVRDFGIMYAEEYTGINLFKLMMMFGRTLCEAYRKEVQAKRSWGIKS